MTPTDLSHHNSSPPSRKRQHAQKKVTRPAPLVRRTTHPGKLNQKPSGSRSSVEPSDGEEEFLMGSSFQQFCATCDKQIVVPNASVLYCSKSCRLQDSQDQSLPLFKTDISPPPSPYALSHADTLPTRDIVPQRSPSNYPAASPNSTTQSSTADLRPSTTDPTRKSRRGSAPRKNSEAARYLAQFGSLDTTRPTYSRSSTMNGEPIPSLSHTPNSLASATSPYTLQQYSASSSSQRTLPQRQPNPRWSSTSFSSRSVGLVTPISHASSFVTITGEQSTKIEGIAHHDFAHSYSYSYKSDLAGPLSYEKKSSFEGSMSPRRGSLKQLFRFEEMRSQPIEGQQTEPESYFP